VEKYCHFLSQFNGANGVGNTVINKQKIVCANGLFVFPLDNASGYRCKERLKQLNRSIQVYPLILYHTPKGVTLPKIEWQPNYSTDMYAKLPIAHSATTS
jgi:hypothetical protein